MDCPNCKLVNPEGALRCDCGFDFPSGRLSPNLSSSGLEVPGSGQPRLLRRSVVRLSAACCLVLGLLACHDFVVAPAARFAPGLPPHLMLAGPSLAALGVVLLAASFAPKKAAKPMVIVGGSFAILGGLPFLVAELSANQSVDSQAAGLISLFLFITLPFFFLPGLAVAAAGGVLAVIQRRSRSKTTS
jgi:hypothetical protein